MVSKGLLVVVGIVLLSAVGVGVLIGMQVGGGSTPEAIDDPAETTPTDASTDTSTSSGSDAPTASPTQSTAEAETETEPISENRTSIPPWRFSNANVTEYVVTFVNEERRANGLEPLAVSGTTAERLASMAQRHSEEMATQGRAIHTIDGASSADRYRQAGLYDTCVFDSGEGSYIVKPDQPESNQLEAVGWTVAGQSYERDGQTRFNAEDRDIARAIVDNWMNSSTYRDRLLLPNVRRLGVGVTVAYTGRVYATANLCG